MQGECNKYSTILSNNYNDFNTLRQRKIRKREMNTSYLCNVVRHRWSLLPLVDVRFGFIVIFEFL